MNQSSRNMALRGWVVIGAAFGAAALPIALNALGLAHYDSNRDGSDPFRPANRGLAERICLVVEAMIPACLLLGPAALLRARRAARFEGTGNWGRVLPATCGACGLALFIGQWTRWGPCTGEHYVMAQAWQFAVAWLLLWSGFVFVRFSAGDEDGELAERKRI